MCCSHIISLYVLTAILPPPVSLTHPQRPAGTHARAQDGRPPREQGPQDSLHGAAETGQLHGAAAQRAGNVPLNPAFRGSEAKSVWRIYFANLPQNSSFVFLPNACMRHIKIQSSIRVYVHTRDLVFIFFLTACLSFLPLSQYAPPSIRLRSNTTSTSPKSSSRRCSADARWRPRRRRPPALRARSRPCASVRRWCEARRIRDALEVQVKSEGGERTVDSSRA